MNELDHAASPAPQIGSGVLPPLFSVENWFNKLTTALSVLGACVLVLICIFITVDAGGRLLFNTPWVGITDLEILFVSFVGFASMSTAVIRRESIQIDLIYDKFSGKTRCVLYLFAMQISCIIWFVLAWRACVAGWGWTKYTHILMIDEWPSVFFSGIGMGLVGIAFLFQVLHILRYLIQRKEFALILIGTAATALLCLLPFAYRAAGLSLSGLQLGGLGFILLMVLLLLRVPLGCGMGLIGLIGLLMILRTPTAAIKTIASIPFVQTGTFIMIAFPMFLLMGEMVSLAGLSDDLFDAARKWMGRLPGGLAIASVGGCAGFGAVCGDSLVTVLTMSSVAMPAMKEAHYNNQLSAGSLAAGGTLGILIPPSMGFIVYSMITEESVGKLFVAGIMPGLLLCAIFMVIVLIRVKMHPDWAPKLPPCSFAEKMQALIKLAPVVMLFLIVVCGILWGWFTPAEGGAIGAVLAFFLALFRRRLTLAELRNTLLRTTDVFGKIFVLFVGLYVLGSFLATSRLPNMLATTVAGLEMNRYAILGAVIILYIFLGCMMNIMPMMLLTLPSIYPTIQALGFDSIWFGVICVIVMEMGMITPPVGMNVFGLAGKCPEIPMASIFRGVLPFFIGMILCTLLIIIFPQIALFLVD